jgi:hypothetical protein
MKPAKALGVVLVGLLALWGFGRFFVSQLGRTRPAGPAGVISAPPPGFYIVERGELAPAEAADALQALVLAQPAGSKVGIRFRLADAEVYWLADTLEERRAGAAGAQEPLPLSAKLIADDFVQAFDDRLELLGRQPPETSTEPLSRQRPDLTDLDPGTLR